MMRVKGGAVELNQILESSFELSLSEGNLNSVEALKSSVSTAEALGWMNDDRTWKASVDYDAEKAIDVTPNFIRVRVRKVSDFTPKTFRTITLSKSRGIQAVIGRLKGKTTTARQSILFRRDKGWTAASAEKWVRDHGMTPI